MRLLHLFNDDRHAKTFSSYLTQCEIENKLDLEKNTDWGSPDYGNIVGKLWVIDEDDMEEARKRLNEYLENPYDEKFKYLRPVSFAIISSLEDDPDKEPLPESKIKKQLPPPPPKRQRGPAGFATFYLILTCTLIFFASMFTSRPAEPYPAIMPAAPLFFSNIVKELYYDYPYAFEIIDKIQVAYGFEKVINPRLLPPEGQRLLQQYLSTTYWQGAYDKIVKYFRDPSVPIEWNQPMFEKLRQGELWRLFTPALLHASVFHLFFNMIWLYVIGKQMEEKIKVPRFLIFVLITGVFTNTMQYLMTGCNFMGFSGILCAMIVFVWVRQSKAPWEGYQLLPSTMKFITGFIAIVALVGIASFFLEVGGLESWAAPIANTAHLTGALSGYILGKTNVFSRKFAGRSK